MTEGFFKIRQSHNKTILKLKGTFDSGNTYCIKEIMMVSRSLHNNILELDMREVQTINKQAMAILITALKNLEAGGMTTVITGFDGIHLNVADRFGL